AHARPGSARWHASRRSSCRGRSPLVRVRWPVAPPAGPPRASRRARHFLVRPPAWAERRRERGAERSVGPRRDDRHEAELLGLGEPAVTVSDGPQLAGEADLAEAREWAPLLARQRDAPHRARHGERDGEIGA